MSAALAYAADASVGGRAVPFGESFRFSDTNPVTGAAYASCVFDDLPGLVQSVLGGVYEVDGREWDRLVRRGEAYSVVGPFRSHRVGGWLTAERGRRGRLDPRRGSCPDCWGSLVAFDSDASLTGRVGAAVLCHCADGW